MNFLITIQFSKFILVVFANYGLYFVKLLLLRQHNKSAQYFLQIIINFKLILCYYCLCLLGFNFINFIFQVNYFLYFILLIVIFVKAIEIINYLISFIIHLIHFYLIIYNFQFINLFFIILALQITIKHWISYPIVPGLGIFVIKLVILYFL